MVKDAEANAEEDKKRREQVEIRNQGEAIVHGAEKAIADLGEQADDALKADVETAVADLKTALEGDDSDDIKAKTEAVSAAMMKMGEAAYQASGAEGAEAGAQGAQGAADDGVVDAEYEEVDEDKSKEA